MESAALKAASPSQHTRQWLGNQRAVVPRGLRSTSGAVEPAGAARRTLNRSRQARPEEAQGASVGKAERGGD